MKIPEAVRGVLRRVAGATVPAFFIGRVLAIGRGPAPGDKKRRTLALPYPLGSTPRVDALPKPTPVNLRKFAETPVARKAINTIKDRVAGMKWRIQPKNARSVQQLVNGAERIQVLTDNLDLPNYDD